MTSGLQGDAEQVRCLPDEESAARRTFIMEYSKIFMFAHFVELYKSCHDYVHSTFPDSALLQNLKHEQDLR